MGFVQGNKTTIKPGSLFGVIVSLQLECVFHLCLMTFILIWFSLCVQGQCSRWVSVIPHFLFLKWLLSFQWLCFCYFYCFDTIYFAHTCVSLFSIFKATILIQLFTPQKKWFLQLFHLAVFQFSRFLFPLVHLTEELS